MKSVSVVVVTQNRAALLAKCLESLAVQTYPETFDIVVADDGSTDNTAEVVRHFAAVRGNVQYVVTRAEGSTAASHAGFLAAKGELVAYADDDTLCDRHWLEEIIAPFDNPQIGCVGGRIEPLWEHEPPAWIQRYHSLLALLDLGPDVREIHWPEDVYGCNIAVQRDWFHRVGGFNPDLIGNCCEGDGETGFQIKLWKAGARVFYAGRAVVYHHITARRMTPEYMKWRFGSQGVTAAYMAFRAHPQRWRLALRVPAFLVARLIFGCLAAIFPEGTPRQLHASFRSEYCRARMITERRFLCDALYRQRGLRDDWLNEPAKQAAAGSHA